MLKKIVAFTPLFGALTFPIIVQLQFLNLVLTMEFLVHY